MRMMARLREAGIANPHILQAMESVPREEFVSAQEALYAYDDRALGISHGQTISQPLMVAMMLEAIDISPGQRVLDVGTGSGYQAAVMAACGAYVVTVERIPELAAEAQSRLQKLGFTNIDVVVGDGSLGVAAKASYDGIVVGAAAPTVPPALREQLAIGGQLVVPVQFTSSYEVLVHVRRTEEGWTNTTLSECRFVPLIGKQGFADSPSYTDDTSAD